MKMLYKWLKSLGTWKEEEFYSLKSYRFVKEDESNKKIILSISKYSRPYIVECAIFIGEIGKVTTNEFNKLDEVKKYIVNLK